MNIIMNIMNFCWNSSLQQLIIGAVKLDIKYDKSIVE